jgi:hypothetical protein
VVTVGFVACGVACFDDILNLDRPEAFVDGCLTGVVTEGDAKVEFRLVLSWKSQVSGTTMKT